MKRAITAFVALVLLVPLIQVVSPAERAEAAVGSQFNPGYIISDVNFYNGTALTADGVQGFLNSRVASCSGGYTCLKDYRQATPNMAASSLCPGVYAGAASDRASDIIAKVGQACNISQKVLLVLLEKEQSLVSSRSPGPGAYGAATGFGCPDTAPCDPAFAGFFYQVYYAARQFQNYAQNPTRWNYRAGRINSILYNPSATCGRGDVFIQNKATAGLYIYTPYQPNAAALTNLYGKGDACSSYGNRNFWRLYSDWFGNPTTSSSLLRTPENASVYLVSGDYKYPVSSGAVFAALAPLGPINFVSQQYLDTLVTRHTAGRAIRDPGGTIYFYDSGIKLPLTSCAQAIDYGASCEADGYVQLTDIQASTFVTGPVMTNLLGTVEGGRYHISGGVKREILDATSQAAAGIPDGMVVLTENAVADLVVGAPIVREGVFAQTRGSSNLNYLGAGLRHPVAPGDEPAIGGPARTAGSLWATSLDKIAQGPGFTGIVTDGSSIALVAAEGRFSLSGGAVPAEVVPIAVPTAFASSYPAVGSIAAGSFIKSPSKADVYVVMPDTIRPIAGWDALLALTPDGQPRIQVVPQTYINSLRLGVTALTAGTLVRSPENATVYYVNGVIDRIALSSFEYPTAAGITRLVFAPESLIQAYPLNTKLMTFGFECGTTRYIAGGGKVHEVPSALASLYPLDYVPLDSFSCVQLPKGNPASAFIRTPDGSIYHLVDGQKRPITSMARFAELGGAAAGYTDVETRFGNYYPTGAIA